MTQFIYLNKDQSNHLKNVIDNSHAFVVKSKTCRIFCHDYIPRVFS